ENKMHFEINTRELKAALKDVSGTVGDVKPIIECVLIEPDDERVKLTTTSLESSTISYIDGLGEGFRIALPHRELTAIINRAKSESVRFELVGDLRVKIDAGRAISELSGSDPDPIPTVHAGDTS